MKPSLLIWDWNGTILMDVQECFDIANHMLAERGIPCIKDMNAYREVFGFPIKAYYEKLGYRFDKESYETVSDEFVELYLDRFSMNTLRPGIEALLKRIRKQGLSQVLLSASREDQLKAQTELFPGLSGCFEEIMGLPDHYAFSKAALARNFIARRGLNPESCLFIGDTDHDFEVSSAIDCPCVLLTEGHQSKARLEKTGAPVLEGLEALAEYIEL